MAQLGELPYLLLSLVVEKPKHCGDIQKELKMFGFLVEEKVVYAAMLKLTKAGLVSKIEIAQPDNPSGTFHQIGDRLENRMDQFLIADRGKKEMDNTNKYAKIILKLQNRLKNSKKEKQIENIIMQELGERTLDFKQIITHIKQNFMDISENEVIEVVNHLLFEKYIARHDITGAFSEKLTYMSMKKQNPVFCLTFIGKNFLKSKK